MFKHSNNKVETIIKTTEQLPPSRLNGKQRLKECGLILAVLCSVLLAVALLTFHPADPSWSQTAWGSDIQNAGGMVGAWVADTLFFVFGSLAYLLPIIFTAMAWVTLRRRGEQESIDLMLWGTRLLGLVILILTSCGLADINFDDIWYFSSGGVIGDVLTSLALPTLNLLGTTLVLLFLWGAGLTLLTGISWLTIVEWLGSNCIRGCQWLMNRIRGDKDELIQPQRLEPISPDVTLESTSSGNPLSDSMVDTTNKTVEHQSIAEEKTPRRFNIHIPDNQNTEKPERKVSLDATIEELEQQARQYDDFAEASDFHLPHQQHHHDQPAEQIEPVQSEALTDDGPIFNPQTLEETEWDEPAIQPAISRLDIVEEEVQSPSLSHTPSSGPSDTLDKAIEISAEDDESSPFDDDVQAFQAMVSDAQANMAATQNPFLMQQSVNLPKPTEPMPTLELLYHPEKRENFIDREALEEIARLVESKLADYKIQAQVVGIFPGPVITRFELDLAPGVKVSRISSLSMDLARSLSAMAVRVVEVIPGKPYVGLELPNMSRQTVFLSDVVSSAQFKEAKSPTTMVLGQDIAGEAVVVDLAKMPHVLVAGTTGSGKSVGVNVMILSMLYKSTPEDVRFIMIDPKMLELSVYEGIPHLLSEVVTDMKDASNALRWCVGEMERRYKLMSVLGVRNIKGFNDKLKMAAEAGHPIHDPLWREGDSMDTAPPRLEKLPYIVVVVDEFADLMMVVGKKVEELIARLAQKARAAGIHLILATQRPSVDVITGLIKANIPTRVAFTVSTKTDSRTILDQSGAESLLGMGDMLYLPPGSSHTIRVHGAFASDDDVHAVVNNWKARGKPNYISDIIAGDQGPESLLPGEKMDDDEDMDPLFDQVVEHVVETRRGSVSGVQRRFKIGYNRAARIVEQLEAQGIVSAPGHNGNREVLAPSPSRD